MEQLTCLKRNLRSPAAPPPDRSETTDSPLGVPAHPGEGALDAATSTAATLTSAASMNGRRPRARAPRPRTDLGTVGATPTPTSCPPTQSTPLGTLSTFLFGRKGGLL